MKRTFFSLSGPAAFLLCCFCIPVSVFGSIAANAAIGTLSWMIIWWISGAVDYAITAFLPMAVNAVFLIADMSSVISNYASETVLLLLGASILTASWSITGLDKRISAKFLSLIGSDLRKQIAFWFILCFFMSSVLPNAVVCAAMTPIAVSMLRYVGIYDIGNSRTGSLLLVTIAYAAGAGGIATPLGGAMNLVVVEHLEQVTGTEFMYISWVIRFLPITAVILISNIIMLVIGVKKEENLGGSSEYFKQQYKAMPKMSRQELMCLVLFVCAAGLSFARELYSELLPGLKPAYVFIICAVLSFFVTAEDGKRLMSWKLTQKQIPWDLIYIFGGGLAIGTLIQKSGAAEAIGNAVSLLGFKSGFWFILVIVIFTILLSDVTSNTATAAISFPIVISMVSGMENTNIIPYMYITAIGVNLSYMLPTSIRAVPVGYGLNPRFMLKKGIPLTVLSIVLMSILSYLLMKFWPLFSTI